MMLNLTLVTRREIQLPFQQSLYSSMQLGLRNKSFSFIHSFILNIYIAPLQENYSEALSTPARSNKAALFITLCSLFFIDYEFGTAVPIIALFLIKMFLLIYNNLYLNGYKLIIIN